MSLTTEVGSTVEVDSPCTRVCRLGAEDFCIGCGRTRGEIAEWLNASSERRVTIRQAAANRLRDRSGDG
ncbi:MAG TPA: DUF1289 domain-containing protein [Steroidobacteraceae bacterium]|nr:DUF1289 domain-containing protein [Steroidobacteraceae bacterium]